MPGHPAPAPAQMEVLVKLLGVATQDSVSVSVNRVTMNLGEVLLTF